MIDLIRELQSWNVNVVVADAWADAAEVKHEYGLELTALDAVDQVDGLVVAVGHDEYRSLKPEQLAALCKAEHKPVIADVKSLFDRHALADAGFTVFRL